MLLHLKRETQHKIEDFRRDQRQESDAEPGDSLDTARTTEEVETHASLISRAEERLRFLDEAITRLEAGNYGDCQSCKRPIPIARLRAVPFAAYCVECQEKRSRAGRNWGDGTMIQPYDQQWTVPEEMEEPPARDFHRPALEEDLSIRSGAENVSRPGAKTPPAPKGKPRTH